MSISHRCHNETDHSVHRCILIKDITFHLMAYCDKSDICNKALVKGKEVWDKYFSYFATKSYFVEHI